MIPVLKLLTPSWMSLRFYFFPHLFPLCVWVFSASIDFCQCLINLTSSFLCCSVETLRCRNSGSNLQCGRSSQYFHTVPGYGTFLQSTDLNPALWRNPLWNPVCVLWIIPLMSSHFHCLPFDLRRSLFIFWSVLADTDTATSWCCHHRAGQLVQYSRIQMLSSDKLLAFIVVK